MSTSAKERMAAFKEAFENSEQKTAALVFACRYIKAAEAFKAHMEELIEVLEARDSREKELRVQRDQLLGLCRDVLSCSEETEVSTGRMPSSVLAGIRDAIARAEKGGV